MMSAEFLYRPNDIMTTEDDVFPESDRCDMGLIVWCDATMVCDVVGMHLYADKIVIQSADDAGDDENDFPPPGYPFTLEKVVETLSGWNAKPSLPVVVSFRGKEYSITEVDVQHDYGWAVLVNANV